MLDTGSFEFGLGILDCGFVVSLRSIYFYSIDPPEANLKSKIRIPKSKIETEYSAFGTQRLAFSNELCLLSSVL